MKDYLFDTNTFNAVAKGSLKLANGSDVRIFATHVQIDELAATKSEAIRSSLLQTFQQILPTEISTSSLVFDISKWDNSEWGIEDGIFEKMLHLLEVLERQCRKKSTPENRSRDILILETALRKNLVLVTDDPQLISV